MNKTTKTILIVSGLLILLAFGIFAGFGYYWGYEIQQQYLSIVHKKEDLFRQKPTLQQALILMHTYYSEFRQYETANYYADYSIKLGADKYRPGWSVHMIKAYIATRDKNIEQACVHYHLALQIAQQYKITEAQMKEFPQYQDVLHTCTDRDIK